MAALANWFYMNGPERIGPVSQDQLCNLFRTGALNLQTMVWSDAFRNWTEASKIAALRSLAPMPTESTAPGASNVPFGGRPMSAPPLDYDAPTTVNGPVGIGGWLILPTIGLIFTPIGQALAVLGAVGLANLATTPPHVAAALNKLAIINGIYGLYVLVTAAMFFGKKRVAPTMMMIAYGAAIALGMYAQVLASPITDAPTTTEWSPLMRPIAVALIWIPYFRMSRRVKNTFVN